MTEREEFRDYLLRHLFIPYRYGGRHALEGLDCSELAQIALAYHGQDPIGDQTADALYRHFMQRGTVVEVADLGDLSFYGAPGHVSHVGVVLDAQRMLEAGGGGADTKTLADAVARGAFVKVSRILRRRDLLAIIRPPGLPWHA